MWIRRVGLLLLGLLGSTLVGWQLVKGAGPAAALPAEEKPIELVQQQIIIEKERLEFPYAIPGTTLVAQYLAVYEGPYLEDGSGEDVVDAAALVLRNTAPVGIDQARVELHWPQGSYVFELDTLPAEKTLVVLERNKQKYAKHEFTGCVGTQSTGSGDWTGYRYVTLEETGLATVKVTNISDTDLQDIRLQYKSFLSPPDVLVGGVTYSVGIPQLAAGESVEVTPFRYVRGYSRFVRISWGEGE